MNVDINGLNCTQKVEKIGARWYVSTGTDYWEGSQYIVYKATTITTTSKLLSAAIPSNYF